MRSTVVLAVAGLMGGGMVGAASACDPFLTEPRATSHAASSSEPPRHAPAVDAKSGTTGEERVALFDALVATVRERHVFAPATWDNLAPLTFDKALPDLREAAAQAVTEADLLDVLTRLGNSLHDPHLGFRPEARPTVRLTLPIVLEPEWNREAVSLVVVQTKTPGVEPGDVVTSYAGIPADAFLRTFADRSNRNQWRGIAGGIAAWMTERAQGVGSAHDGATVLVGLRKLDGSVARVELAWGWHHEGEADLAAPAYEHPRCGPGLPVRSYPTYELASHGANFCLYVSSNAAYAPFPVLRFFSFDFGNAFGAEAEHEHLTHVLGELHGVRGVVIDLRDNAGGNDAGWPLDWFAPKPYLALATHVRKTPWLSRLPESEIVNMSDGWSKALARAPDGVTVSRFDGCLIEDCTDTRQRPAHRIVAVPVALLVGPRCHSSCDRFARIFDENGLGPIVGEPSSAGLTVLRSWHPVSIAGKKLGALGLALSLDVNPFTGAPVEGAPIHVDVPVTWSWAKRDVYDKELVDGAIGALAR